MANILSWLTGNFSRRKKHLEISEEIKEKIDSFLRRFFPRKADTTIKINVVKGVKHETLYPIIYILFFNINYFISHTHFLK